jgi:periplasmic iron binding protein
VNPKTGPIIGASVLIGIGLLIALSLESSPGGSGSMGFTSNDQPSLLKLDQDAKSADTAAAASQPIATSGFREYPIGDPEGFEKNHLRVAAVWLPSVTMEGSDSGTSGAIHVEADISATEENPNGFAAGEFVPYLKIAYKLTSADGKTILDQGMMLPMVARDGLHYGTSMVPPKPGTYKLSYKIEPPSMGGLGRHHDPITGVAPWWDPFEVEFEWEYEGQTVPTALN